MNKHRLKILLVTGKYLPDKSGGIENYVHALASLLLEQNYDVQATILNSSHNTSYYYEGIKVIPLTDSFTSFEELLKNEQYDICHFHEYSEYGGIELFWIKKAKECCKKVFFTFHLPYLTCYKNDFRYKGIEDCNNFSSPQRCTDCVIATKLNYKKAGFKLKNILIDRLLPILNKQHAAITLKDKIAAKHKDLKQLLEICDNVFIIADWFKDILINNGYDSDVLKRIPPITTFQSDIRHDNKIKHKIVFAARIEKQKGLHLICDAMFKLKTKGLQLDVYGNKVNDAYFDECMQIYKFNYKGVVPSKTLLQLLPAYDFLLLPSVFTEMFPLILTEAFSIELPVIVSSAKGNVDVVKNMINGFVFEYANASDLALIIDKAYSYKNEMWKPQFAMFAEKEENKKEILSYYS